MSRRDQILIHLMNEKSITPLEALEKYGCLRLGARISEIKQEGYKINTTINKGKKKYAIYTLDLDATLEAVT